MQESDYLKYLVFGHPPVLMLMDEEKIHSSYNLTLVSVLNLKKTIPKSNLSGGRILFKVWNLNALVRSVLVQSGNSTFLLARLRDSGG